MKILNQDSNLMQVSRIVEKDLDFAFSLLYIKDQDQINETVLGKFLKKQYNKQTARRLYIRMFISLVESILFEFRSEALERKSKFTQAEMALLEDKAFELSNKGEAITRPYYGSIEKNLKFTFRHYAKAFDIKYCPDYSNNGWESFQKAIKIRNRITHPKLIDDMNINDDEQKIVGKAYEWFSKSYHALLAEHIKKLETEIEHLNE